MMYIFIRSKIHRSTITTVARPQFAGSVEPATRAKQHYITGYIQWHYAIYRFTDCTFLFLFLLCSTAYFFIACENPPNKCAKMTRQNILPWKTAGFIRENNPPNYLPEKLAISTRGLLARDPPFPAQNPQAGHGPPTPLPPPPYGSANGVGGGGREPARPTHAYWTGTFFSHLMNGYIFLYNNNTYIFCTERIEWSIHILL
jgi:hypothetical protein